MKAGKHRGTDSQKTLQFLHRATRTPDPFSGLIRVMPLSTHPLLPKNEGFIVREITTEKFCASEHRAWGVGEWARGCGECQCILLKKGRLMKSLQTKLQDTHTLIPGSSSCSTNKMLITRCKNYRQKTKRFLCGKLLSPREQTSEWCRHRNGQNIWSSSNKNTPDIHSGASVLN